MFLLFHKIAPLSPKGYRARWRRDPLFLLEATVVLAFVYLGLRLLPFQSVRSLLSRFEAQTRLKSSTDAADTTLAPRLLGAVDRAGRRLGMTCLPRALTAHALLARRGIRTNVQIGVSRVPGSPLEAHAWVECSGVVVMGQIPNLTRFVKMPLPEGAALTRMN